MAGDPGVDDELVLVDQPHLRQGRREGDAADEDALARLLLEPLGRLAQVAPQQLGVPVDPLQGARHDVLLGRADRLRERLRPRRP